MSIWSRLTNVLRGDRLIDEIDEEHESHLEDAIAHGRDPEEARKAFGSTLRRREESRDVRLVPWLDALRADAAFGWRQLTKHGVTSAVAVLSLGLGIGACTTAFRLIDALLLRPLPVAEPERLYVLTRRDADRANDETRISDGFEYPLFRALRAAAGDRAQLIAVSYVERADVTHGLDGEMEKAHRQYVSGWMFDAFGLRAALGRLLTESDDLQPRAHPYAVISHDYWAQRFGRNPGVIGAARFRWAPICTRLSVSWSRVSRARSLAPSPISSCRR